MNQKSKDDLEILDESYRPNDTNRITDLEDSLLLLSNRYEKEKRAFLYQVKELKEQVKTLQELNKILTGI